MINICKISERTKNIIMLVFYIAHVQNILSKFSSLVNILFEFKTIQEEVAHMASIVGNLVKVKEIFHRTD